MLAGIVVFAVRWRLTIRVHFMFVILGDGVCVALPGLFDSVLSPIIKKPGQFEWLLSRTELWFARHLSCRKHLGIRRLVKLLRLRAQISAAAAGNSSCCVLKSTSLTRAARLSQLHLGLHSPALAFHLQRFLLSSFSHFP